jgi:dCTP deaminase
MVLTRDVILRAIAAGELGVDPFRPEQVGPASIDLHLGNEIRVMTGGPDVIEVTEATDYRDVTRVQPLDAPYLLRPGETIHAITRERLRLPGNVAGWLEGRSRYARLGLMIHVTSGFIAPGVDSRQVLEMSNVAGRPLAIHAGVSVCQVVLQRCEGNAVYAGRFARQDSL